MKDGGSVVCSWASSRPARSHALLHLVAQLAELLALLAHACLVLGCGTYGRLATFLGLARATLLCDELALPAFGGNGSPSSAMKVPACWRAIKPRR